MEELKIDWKQERPNSSQILEIWNGIKLTRINNWTNSANTFTDKITETHSNGGIQLHKYKIEANEHFNWFVQRNRLDEIEFLNNIFKQNDLEDYRNNLQIKDSKPSVKIIKYWTDIYEIPGRLSRMMGLGGAYKSIDQKLAWSIATDFIKEEFENRFEEFNSYDFVINSAEWFHNIAWDNSTLLFDKRKYEIIIIDITDSD